MNKAEIKRYIVNTEASSKSKGMVSPYWFLCILAGALFSVVSCSNTEQHNITPALVSKDGGTAGGPISGRLVVQVFDDTVRRPIPNAQVFLGGTEGRSETTTFEGIATFDDVSGPQDIHVYACVGCEDAQLPLLYQNTSFYQVNASRVAIPMVPRDTTLSSGRLEGKIFNTEKDETGFHAVIDALGGFSVIGPTRSLTHQRIDFNSSSPKDLTFIYAKDLDNWAEAAGVQQNFRQIAVFGKVVNSENTPQPGVEVFAEYFNGTSAGRPYYFKTVTPAGPEDPPLELDPDLNATTSNGYFLLLKLQPNNDLVIYSASRGIGAGQNFLRLPSEGTAILNLLVLPLSSTVSINGRVVAFRPDYREEELLGPLSSGNTGVARALINFSGDTFEESFVANQGVVTAGNYFASGRLPNSRYVAFLSAGSGFRATFQEVSFSDRSKSNYPLTVVRLNTLTNMVIQAAIPDPERTDEDGNVPIRLGFLPNNGEFLGRISEKTGTLDENGDPHLKATANVELRVTDESGNDAGKAYAIDIGGNLLCRFGEGVCVTDASGGFVVLDLPAFPGSDMYTISARDSGGGLIDRQTIPVYANSVRLVELIKRGTASIASPLSVKGFDGSGIAEVTLELSGADTLECTADCVSDTAGDVGITPFTEGEYIIRMGKSTGGGDYRLSFGASKRRLGFTAFRVGESDASYNLTFSSGLGPLGPSGRLPFDFFFDQSPEFKETIGAITLPSGFQVSDLRVTAIGAIVPQGRVFTGMDTGVLKGEAASQYRIRSSESEGIESYFLGVSASTSDGKSSYSLIQGLPEIPSVMDVSLLEPPVLLSPGSGATAVGLEPIFSWVPGAGAGSADLYQVRVKSPGGMLLWQAWVPGTLQEIKLPPFPSEVNVLMNPFSAGTEVVWEVASFQAQGISFHGFNRKELAEKISSISTTASQFTP